MKKRDLMARKSLASLALTTFVFLASTPVAGHAIGNDKQASGVLLAANCSSGSAPAYSQANASCSAVTNDENTATAAGEGRPSFGDEWEGYPESEINKSYQPISYDSRGRPLPSSQYPTTGSEAQQERMSNPSAPNTYRSQPMMPSSQK